MKPDLKHYFAALPRTEPHCDALWPRPARGSGALQALNKDFAAGFGYWLSS